MNLKKFITDLKLQFTPNEWRWCLYDAANSAFSLVVMTTFFPVFFAKFIVPADAAPGSVTAGLGTANAAAGLAAAVAAPILGAYADRHGFRKHGLYIALPLGCIFTLLLTTPSSGMVIITLLFYALAVFFFTAGNVFYDSMLVDITTQKRSDYISGAGFAIGYFGSVIPFTAILLLLMYNGENIQSFNCGFIITAVWWAILALPLLTLRLPRQQNICTDQKESNTNHLLTLKKIWQTRDLKLFLFAYFLYIDGVNTIIVMAVPYGTELGLGAKELVLLILAIQLIAFPCSLFYGIFATRLGTRQMLRFGIICYSITVAIAAILPIVEQKSLRSIVFLLLALTVAINQGGIQALSRSCFSRLIPEESAAEYFGIYNIFGKFATILGPLLFAASGWIFGGAQYGILSLLILFAGGLFLLEKVRYL